MVQAAAPTVQAGLEQPAWWGQPALRLTATYQQWAYPDLTDSRNQTMTRPFQLVGYGDWRRIARQPIRVSLLGRGNWDLEQPDSFEGRLLLGYVEALDLGRLFDLRLGRWFPLDGTTLGPLDGAWLDLSGLPWFGLGVHLGRPVSFTSEATLPKFSSGGRLWLQGLPWAYLEARYERQEDSLFGHPDRSRVGGDLLVELAYTWFLFANGDYELQTSTLERGRAGVRYRPANPWRGQAELFRYDPLFAPGSVFADMDSDPHWGFTAQAGRDISERWSFSLRWTTRVFQQEDPPASKQYVADPSHAADLVATWHPIPSMTLEGNGGGISGAEGASLLGGLSAGWRYAPLELAVQAGGYFNAHDRRFNDPSGILNLFGSTGHGIQRNLARGAWIDLSIAPWPYVAFALRGEGYTDATAQRSYRLFAQISGYVF